ncbi:MAG: TIGR04255 family protein [Pseudonocardiaceae bacterium]
MSTPLGSPVNEVILSIAFPRNEALSGPFLGATVGDLLNKFPKVEQQAPYEMPLEFPLAKGTLGVTSPQGQFVFSMQPPEPRYWFLSDDEIGLVQLQSNYLAYNWRRKHETQKYPGYELLAETFRSLKEGLSSTLERAGRKPVQPSQAELTYINIISPNELWSSHREMTRIIDLRFPELTQAEQVGLRYSKEILDERGSFVGRIHVLVQPAVNLVSGGPVINLTIIARSGTLDEDEPESYSTFMQMAHDRITDSFKSLTTDDARRVWGIE